MSYQFSQEKKHYNWMDIGFYSAIALLAAVAVCYGIFSYKAYLQNQKIDQVNAKLLSYGTQDQKAQEKKVLDYQEKIADYALIIQNHKISLNVFNFIEQKTLPRVWFFNVNLAENKNTINLLGQADSMQTLSQQVHLFEESRDYVSGIDVLTSEAAQSGGVRFTLQLSLNPKLFDYYTGANK